MECKPAFYTVNEFSKLLRAHPNTIRKSIKKGYIQAFKIGTSSRSGYRIPSSEIERMGLFNLKDIVEKMKG